MPAQGDGWIARYRRALLIALVLYWSAAVAATHLPMPDVPSAPDHTDKVVHCGMYFGLAGLLMLVVSSRIPQLTRKHYLICGGVCLAYGGLDELSQIPLSGRFGDWADFAADALGVSLGLLCFLGLRRLFPAWWSGVGRSSPELASQEID